MEWSDAPWSGAIGINSTTNENNFRELFSVFTSKLRRHNARDSIHRASWLIARAIEKRNRVAFFFWRYSLNNSRSSLYKFSSFPLYFYSLFRSFSTSHFFFSIDQQTSKRNDEIY